MTTQFINVTEIRTKISEIAESTTQGTNVIVLKNGKPTAALVNYEEYEKYQEWQKEKQKSAIVQAFKKLAEEADALGIGDTWLAEKGFNKNSITDEQILDALYEEDEKNNS